MESAVNVQVNDFLAAGKLRSNWRPLISFEFNNDKGKLLVSPLITTSSWRSTSFLEIMLPETRIESKPFALGVRIEHPQSLIDKIQ